MPKSFGRPATIDDRARRPVDCVIVRDINLPREGHALEGVYAATSARNALGTAPYEGATKAAFSRALVWWTGVSLFWIGLAWLFLNGA
jgi:hypothetical protein